MRESVTTDEGNPFQVTKLHIREAISNNILFGFEGKGRESIFVILPAQLGDELVRPVFP